METVKTEEQWPQDLFANNKDSYLQKVIEMDWVYMSIHWLQKFH